MSWSGPSPRQASQGSTSTSCSSAQTGSPSKPASRPTTRSRRTRTERPHLIIGGRRGSRALMIRIAVIGAGRVEFRGDVVADPWAAAELAGLVTIALHDIDAERLAYAERATAAIVRRTGAGYRVEA